ncbi:MAG: SMI1/KNR4 family protein [Acidimicrobiales bacterium]
MEPEPFLAALEVVGDLTSHVGASPSEVEAFERDLGARLPATHRRLLMLSNGLEAYDGYIRLFGVGPGATIDMRAWNDPELWKFAYRGRADSYLCIGEDGQGHQYAYRLEELSASNGSPPVYCLLVNDMSIVVVYTSFDDFLDAGTFHGMLRVDGDFVNWRDRLGPLNPREHVVHRSFYIFDEVNRDLYERMDAAQAMIFLGDAWETGQAREGVPDRLEFYKDSKGRDRLRVAWRDGQQSSHTARE